MVFYKKNENKRTTYSIEQSVHHKKKSNIMGTGLFIIDAIIIAIVILPFALFINGSKKRERQLRKALQSEATKHNCNLSKLEVHSNFAIGLDQNEKKLVFYKKAEKRAYTTLVDLKTVAACKALKINKQVKNKTKHYELIDKLKLSFIHHNKNKVTDLELYNNDDTMTLNNEVLLSQKWEDEVNTLLKTMREIQPAEKQEQLRVAIS